MFSQPETSVIIGITKSRMVEQLYDKEELLEVA